MEFVFVCAALSDCCLEVAGIGNNRNISVFGRRYPDSERSFDEIDLLHIQCFIVVHSIFQTPLITKG